MQDSSSLVFTPSWHFYVWQIFCTLLTVLLIWIATIIIVASGWETYQLLIFPGIPYLMFLYVITGWLASNKFLRVVLDEKGITGPTTHPRISYPPNQGNFFYRYSTISISKDMIDQEKTLRKDIFSTLSLTRHIFSKNRQVIYLSYWVFGGRKIKQIMEWINQTTGKTNA